MTVRDLGHEAAAGGRAGKRGGAKGEGVREAPGRAAAPPEDPALEAGTVIEVSKSPGEAPEAAESGPDSPWSRAGVPVDVLVFPVTTPRKIARRGLLGRFRGSIFGRGRKMRESGPEIAVPVNLRRWTWELLPHVGETRDGTRLTRLLDRIAWHTTLPDARHVLHAERLRRRRESLPTRALVRFAALVARRRCGPPPWFADDPDGDGS